MARISVEEAVKEVGNRFDLILVAAQRASEIQQGSPTTVNKAGGPTLAALREIEQGLYTREDYEATDLEQRLK